MKLSDLKPLKESVTFNAVELKKFDDGKEYYTAKYNKVEKQCWVCDGTGYEDHGSAGKHECGYCHGKKTYVEDEDEGPELNVANENAYLIANMLGLDIEDGTGIVKYDQIPAVMKRLLQLKNTDQKDSFVRPTETSRGEAHVDRSGDVPAIRRGPTIHDMGVDAQRLGRYIDKLIEIFKYARDHKMHVAWA